MQPHRLGRILGISARVAADKLRERTASQISVASQRPPAGQTASPSRSPKAPSTIPSASRSTSAAAPSHPAPSLTAQADGARRLARGAGRFTSALLHPFAHATGVLTLQITGVFFALFTAFFVVHSWQIYKVAGWRDHHLPLYAAFAVLFAWFAGSSFWRARHKQKHP
jgi:hypothetical protein